MSETKSGFYPVTPEVVKVLTEALEGGEDKNVLAASIGVTASCLDQWLRGDTKQIRADNYIALCMQKWEFLQALAWYDPEPEFTKKRYGKTMDELHVDYEAQGEKFLMNLRPAKQRESKSNGVTFVCADCGKALASKVMTKSGSFVVGVERCEACAEVEVQLARKARQVASVIGESTKVLAAMTKRLTSLAEELESTAKAIEKPGKVAEPEVADGEAKVA